MTASRAARSTNIGLTMADEHGRRIDVNTSDSTKHVGHIVSTSIDHGPARQTMAAHTSRFDRLARNLWHV